MPTELAQKSMKFKMGTAPNGTDLRRQHLILCGMGRKIRNVENRLTVVFFKGLPFLPLY